MKTREAFCVCAALLLITCRTQSKRGEVSFPSAPLYGMIYDADNQPCAGVQLGVDGSAGPQTDIRGRFIVPELSRGGHTISAKKSGYETLLVSISFLNRTDVLHLHMTSFGQLLAMAEKSIGEQRWADAEGFLGRAEKLNPEDAVLRYLLAINAYKTGAFSTAADYLAAILAGGIAAPAVYIFLADIWEINLGDSGKAVSNLESYLILRPDPGVEKRLEELKRRAEQQKSPAESQGTR
jgi:tetratricopeptide (TPR) repeat protein